MNNIFSAYRTGAEYFIVVMTLRKSVRLFYIYSNVYSIFMSDFSGGDDCSDWRGNRSVSESKLEHFDKFTLLVSIDRDHSFLYIHNYVLRRGVQWRRDIGAGEKLPCFPFPVR